jgi:hypothetical protein
MNGSRFVTAFVLGAIVGTLGDRVHTFKGVLGYPHAFAFGEAAWVPLLMGGAGIAMVSGYGLVHRVVGSNDERASMANVLSAFVWFAAAYAASGFFHQYPIALTLAFVAAFVARALREPVSRAAWVYALVTALVGTLFEAGLSATGAFRYYTPDVIGVPMWLPGLYLHASLLARALALRWSATR